MRILVITSLFPFPLNEGGKTSQFVFLKEIVKDHDVTLFCTEHQNEHCISGLNGLIPALKVLTAKPAKSSKKISLHNRLIAKIIWELRKLLPKKEEALYQHKSFIFPVSPRGMCDFSSVLEVAESQHWDIIQVDFVDNADLAFLLPRSVRKVLVIHDLRFASVMQAMNNDRLDPAYTEYYAATVKVAELSYFSHFDGLVTFSIDDKEKIISEGIHSPVMAAPFGVNDALFEKEIDQKELQQLIFIGSGIHHPNFDAVNWYVTEFRSQLSTEYSYPLHVIGNWTDGSIEKIGKTYNVFFDGFVEDLSIYVGSSVMIVPLRIGSGIRTKILEAFALGIPVISTTIGSEGIGAQHNVELLIADTPEAFVMALRRLVSPQFRMKLVQNARKFVRANFSQKQTAKKRIEFFEELKDHYWIATNS